VGELASYRNLKEKTMTVRAKFVCNVKTQTMDGYTVKFTPVTSGSEENDQYFKWTPFGSLEMGTLNPEAAEQFTPGMEYYVDFTPASKG